MDSAFQEIRKELPIPIMVMCLCLCLHEVTHTLILYIAHNTIVDSGWFIVWTQLQSC